MSLSDRLPSEPMGTSSRRHPLFPGATKPHRMRISDPTIYHVNVTEIMSERGQIVSEIRTAGGRLVGLCTIPAALLADVEDAQ